MKKFLAILLACAMFLPLLASCGSMQADEFSVEAYPQAENNAQNVAVTKDFEGYKGRTEIDTSKGEYHGDGVNGVVEGNGSNETENAQEVNLNGSYDTFYARKAWAAVISEWFAEGTSTSTFTWTTDLGKLATDDYYPQYKGMYIYEIYTAEQFASFLRMLNYEQVLGDKTVNSLITAAGVNPSKRPGFDFENKVIVLKRDFDITRLDHIQPSGNGNMYFNGILDGEGHVVKGRSQTFTSHNGSLLGPLVGATVKNIAFVDYSADAYLDTDANSDFNKVWSALSIWSVGDVTIENVYFQGSSVGGNGNVGALIGDVKAGSVTVKNTKVDFTFGGEGATLIHGSRIGGMFGFIRKADVDISNCEVVCNMEVSQTVTPSTGTIIDVVNNSTGATGTDKKADLDANGKQMYLWEGFSYSQKYGAMIGAYEGGDNTFKIDNCKTSGSIAACGSHAGGVIGYHTASANAVVEISNVVSDVDISVASEEAIAAAVFKAQASNIAFYQKSNDEYVAYTYDSQTGLNQIANQYNCWGGIVGDRIGGSEFILTNATNNGDISGRGKIGGIVGEKGNTSSGRYFQLNNCVNNGVITGTGDAVGGIMGYMTQGPLTVTGGVNNGTVSGANHVGGLGGVWAGSAANSITIDGFTNNGAVSGTNYVAGLLGSKGNGSMTHANDMTIKNSTNNGAVSGTSKVAGVLGDVIKLTQDGKTTTIENCVNNGKISGTSTSVAGIVAVAGDTIGTSAEVFITDCTNRGDLSIGGSNAGGIVADYSGKGITVTGCVNEGNITPTSYAKTIDRWVGGVAGYIRGNGTTPIPVVKFDGCVNTGTVIGNRASGSLIAYIQHATDVDILNCTVAADMDFRIYEASNQYVGGIAGLLCENGDVLVDNCTVKGTLSLADMVGTTAYAGGIVGCIRNLVNSSNKNFPSSTVKVSNCTVAVEFSKTGKTTDDTNEIAEIMFANLGTDDITYTFENLQYVSMDSVATYENSPLYDENENPEGVLTLIGTGDVTVEAVGSQYKENDNGTYSLRYVFSVSNLSAADKALGFNVKLAMDNGNGYTPREITVYCPTIYTSIQSGDETFTAEEGSYLFTLMIDNIPADQIELVALNATDVKAYVKNADLFIDAFVGAKSLVKLTKEISLTEEQNVVHFPENGAMWAERPAAFAGVQGNIPDIDFDDGLSASVKSKVAGCYTVYRMGVDQVIIAKSCTDADHDCYYEDTDGTKHYNLSINGAIAFRANRNGSADCRYHLYFDTSYWTKHVQTPVPDDYDLYYSTTVEIPEGEAGLYDFCFLIRHNGKNTTRSIQIQVNDEAYGDQSLLYYKTTSSFTEDGKVASNSENDSTYRDSYLTGFSAELKEGTNTVTFRYRGSDANIHIRDFYVVKRAADVVKDYNVSELTATMPEALTNVDNTVITIEGSGCEAGSTLTVQKSNSNAYDMVCWDDTGVASAHGAIKLKSSGINHYYLNYSTSSAKDALGNNAEGKAYIRWTFNVVEAGDYEMYFNMRLKWSDAERVAVMQIDSMGKKYDMSLDFSSYTGKDDEAFLAQMDASENTYLATGIILEDLAAGTHTITMELPEGSNNSMHFRNLYLVKKNVTE